MRGRGAWLHVPLQGHGACMQGSTVHQHPERPCTISTVTAYPRRFKQVTCRHAAHTQCIRVGCARRLKRSLHACSAPPSCARAHTPACIPRTSHVAPSVTARVVARPSMQDCTATAIKAVCVGGMCGEGAAAQTCSRIVRGCALPGTGSSSWCEADCAGLWVDYWSTAMECNAIDSG